MQSSDNVRLMNRVEAIFQGGLTLDFRQQRAYQVAGEGISLRFFLEGVKLGYAIRNPRIKIDVMSDLSWYPSKEEVLELRSGLQIFIPGVAESVKYHNNRINNWFWWNEFRFSIDYLDMWELFAPERDAVEALHSLPPDQYTLWARRL